MKKSLVLLLLVAACMPVKNSSLSPVQDKSGKKIGSANVSVISKYDEGTTMTVIISDGEIFKGEVMRDSVESEYTDDMFEITGGGSRYYSKGYAMLINNVTGNSMECTMKIAKANKSLAWGGGGVCKVSDGRVLPFTLSSGNRS